MGFVLSFESLVPGGHYSINLLKSVNGTLRTVAQVPVDSDWWHEVTPLLTSLGVPEPQSEWRGPKVGEAWVIALTREQAVLLLRWARWRLAHRAWHKLLCGRSDDWPIQIRPRGLGWNIAAVYDGSSRLPSGAVIAASLKDSYYSTPTRVLWRHQ